MISKHWVSFLVKSYQKIYKNNIATGSGGPSSLPVVVDQRRFSLTKDMQTERELICLNEQIVLTPMAEENEFY